MAKKKAAAKKVTEKKPVEKAAAKKTAPKKKTVVKSSADTKPAVSEPVVKKAAAKKRAVKKPAPKKSATQKTSIKMTAPQWASPAQRAELDRIDREHHERLMEQVAVERVLNKYRDELMALPGVKGISVGSKFVEGSPTGKMAIRLHMESNEAKQRLKADAIAGRHLPNKRELQKTYDDMPVDLIVWKFELAAAQKDGAEIHSRGGLGTLGTTVASGDGTLCWLTAGHVMMGGPISRLPFDVDVLNSTQSNVIGFVPEGSSHFCKDTKMDAALIVPQNDLTSMPSGRVVGDPRPGREVSIVSDHAGGKVVGIIDSYPNLPIDLAGDNFKVEDHFLIRPPENSTGDFITRGDSGAIVMDANAVVGIVRAVLTDLKMAVACTITNALKKIAFRVS